MATSLVPSIGLRGLFELRDPYHNSLQENAAYTCVSVRRIADIVAEGKDPFKLYYEPKGLTPADYEEDVAAKISIIGLQADDGIIVRVPSSYINRLPSGGGVPYKVLLLTAELGAIKDEQDLSPLFTRIQEVIESTVGISDVDVSVVAVSNTTMVDRAQSDAIEAARADKISQKYTDYSEVLRLTNELNQVKEQYNNLINWVKDNCAIP